jgi:hypothetical protein
MTSFTLDQPPPIPTHAPAPIAPVPATPGAGRKLLPRGTVAWGILALMALSYLTLAAVRPDMIAAYFPMSAKPGSAEPNQGQRATTAETEDLGKIRDTLSQLQSDIGQLKSDVAETSSQNKELSARLAALAEQSSKVASATATGAAATASETTVAAAPPAPSQLPPPELRLAPAPVNGPIASKPVEPPALTISATEAIAAAAAAAPKATAPVAAAPVLKAAEKAADVKLINAPLAPAAASAAASAAPAASAKALETGSVKAADATAPASAAAAPAAVKPPAKPVGLQIASAPSLDALRLSWSLLSETHADSLKNLEPRYSTGVDANGLTYNLMAGPVKSAADAKKMCKALTAKAIACKVVGEFGGEAL